MSFTKNINWACAISVWVTISVGAIISPAFAAAPSQDKQADQSAIQKQVGAIKSIVGNTVAITSPPPRSSVWNQDKQI
jgi:hypothetical protein